MLLEEFITKKISEACDLQQKLTIDKEMIRMIESDNYDTQLIKDWMRKYNLLQGFNKVEREKIASVAKTTMPIIRKNNALNDSENFIEIVFKKLLSAFFEIQEIKDRKWVSATSKLLWCIYPSHFIMYDVICNKS